MSRALTLTLALAPPRAPTPYLTSALSAGCRRLSPSSLGRLRRSHGVGMVDPATAAAAVRSGGEDSKKRKTATAWKWPLIKPKNDLQINHLEGDHLLTVLNFMTAVEAKAFIEAAESLGFTHQGSLGPAKGEAYRDNERISVNDPDFAECIWQSGLNRMFNDIKLSGKVAVGLNPNIRFYRYDVGQCFGRHIDMSIDLGWGRETQYTLLIYLSGSSGSLVGGETVFYDQGQIVAEVAPAEGMALLHIHGSICMFHEARAVTKGVKYILRSDVVFA